MRARALPLGLPLAVWLACVPAVATAASPTPPAPAPPAAGSRPNIVLIMLDDIPGDVMPHLLRFMPRANALFLERGLDFPNSFGQDPLCCPGRASTFTGLYAAHHGVRANLARRFHPEMSIATALDEAGYTTLLVGKYLNNANKLADRTPPGWDHVAMFARAGYRDFTLLVDGRREPHGPGSQPPRAGYSTDVLARRAVSWLRRAPAKRPVFLYLAPFAAHTVPFGGLTLPPQPATRHRRGGPCDRAGYRRTPAYLERDVSDKPPWVARLPIHGDPYLTPRGYPLEPVCRVLLSVDEALDGIVAELRREGRSADTLFLLTVDNGMSWGDHRFRPKRVPWATRIPLFVHWSGGIGDERERIPTWVQDIDLAPTFAEAAGATLGPYPTGQEAPDGISLLPLIASRGATVPPRTALFEDHVDAPRSPLTWRTLRTTSQHPLGLWRYTEWRSGFVELYDLAADPWELHNVASAHPDIVAALSAQLATYPPSVPAVPTEPTEPPAPATDRDRTSDLPGKGMPPV